VSAPCLGAERQALYCTVLNCHALAAHLVVSVEYAAVEALQHVDSGRYEGLLHVVTRLGRGLQEEQPVRPMCVCVCVCVWRVGVLRQRDREIER
jgi:hypothetical protein